MLHVLLPAFNEASSLPVLLERFERALADAPMGYAILVVDDGSVDQTATAARRFAARMPVEVVSHDRNLGLGVALRTGLTRLAAGARKGDLILSMDADNTHDPVLAGRLVGACQAGADVVIASRYATGGGEIGLSLGRRLLSRGASALLSLALPVEGATDYTCGYRLYRAELIQRALLSYGAELITETSFVCTAELLVKLGALGARVAEVPMVLRYDLKAGPSKMKKLPTISRYLRFVAAERRRLSAAPGEPRLGRSDAARH